MYRTPVKTTKKTQYKCLKCQHIKPGNYKLSPYGCYVECMAPNRCFASEFNARDYTCQQHRSFREMSKSEIESIVEKQEKAYADKVFKEYAKKFYQKKQAREMIKERMGKK